MKVVRALLAAGADIHKRDASGWAPLCHARHNERAAVVEALEVAAEEEDDARAAEANVRNAARRRALEAAAAEEEEANVREATQWAEELEAAAAEEEEANIREAESAAAMRVKVG